MAKAPLADEEDAHRHLSVVSAFFPSAPMLFITPRNDGTMSGLVDRLTELPVVVHEQCSEVAAAPFLVPSNELMASARASDRFVLFDSPTNSAFIAVHLYKHGTEDRAILSSCTVTTQRITVTSAIPLRDRFLASYRTTDPLLLIQAVAQVFGRVFQCGRQLSRFVMNERIALQSGREALFSIPGSPTEVNVHCVSRMVNASDGRYMEIAYAMALDFALLRKEFDRPMHESSNDVFFVAPTLAMTRRDLLQSEFVFAAIVDSSADGLLWAVRHPNYTSAAGFSQGAVYLERNGLRVTTPMPGASQKTGKVWVCLEWTSTRLACTAARPGDSLDESQFRRTQATPITFPPPPLLELARIHGLLPKTIYDSLAMLQSAVVELVQAAEDKICTTDAFWSFWDVFRHKRRVTGRRPKLEPEITKGLHAIMFDAAQLKNIHLLHECQAGGGKLDFLATGIVAPSTNARICIECKCAHSDDLYHGIEEQLPTYMRTFGASVGIFVVPYFAGRHFEKPARTSTEIQVELSTRVLARGLDIRPIILDLSGPHAPSRRHPTP